MPANSDRPPRAAKTHPSKAPRRGAGPGKRGAPRRATGTGPRDVAREIIELVCEDGRPLSTVLEGLGPAADLSPRDAGLARAIARTTIRRLGDIDHILATLISKPLPHKAAGVRTVLRLSAAQLLFMRQADHAAVNVAVTMLKSDAATGGFAGLANAVLRRLVRERDGLLEALPVEANTPPWLWARWVNAYGAAAAAAMAAVHRSEPPLDLAFAPGAARPEGATALPGGGARLAATAVDEIAGYEAGSFWVQDFAAQLPASLLGDVRGKSVLDMCAAPGGKTMQLAAAGAQVTAVERDAARAQRLRQNLARTKLDERVTVVVADAREVDGVFDAVLLDAPCSATGTLRRQPDVALHRSTADINALRAIQADLIKAAEARTRVGGTMVYATCSLEPEEGEDQLSFVASTLPGLTLDPVRDGPAVPFANAQGAIRTAPHLSIPGTDGLTGMDGFFAARFQKHS